MLDEADEKKSSTAPPERVIFSTSDHNGKQIHLFHSTFYGHILPGHPEMRSEVEAIQDCIQSPDFVSVSNKNQDSHIYYKQSDKLSRQNFYVRAVVDQSSTDYGFIKTAFTSKKIDPAGQGEVIYPNDEKSED